MHHLRGICMNLNCVYIVIDFYANKCTAALRHLQESLLRRMSEKAQILLSLSTDSSLVVNLYNQGNVV